MVSGYAWAMARMAATLSSAAPRVWTSSGIRVWVVATKSMSCSPRGDPVRRRRRPRCRSGDRSAGTTHGAAFTERHSASQSARSCGKACWQAASRSHSANTLSSARLRALGEALEHRDVQERSTEQRHRSDPVRVPGQEHLLRGGPVGDADEVGLRVVEIGEDLVDVVREQGRGVEARVTVDAVHARLDGRTERGRVRQVGEGRTGHGRRPGAALFDEDQVPAGVRGEERAHPADGVHRRVARAAREPDDGIGLPVGTGRREHDDPDRQLAVAAAGSVLGDHQRPAAGRHAVDRARFEREPGR